MIETSMIEAGPTRSPSASDVVHVVRHGDIAIVEIDNPPVNATSQAVRAGLAAAIAAVPEDASTAAIVIAAAGRTFVAGADIKEQSRPSQPPFLPEVYNVIEACSK